MRAATCLILIGALGLAAKPATAEPSQRTSVQLHYLRAPGAEACPAESALHDEVARRMGYDPFDSAATEQRIVARLGHAGRSLAATIELFDAKGDRQWSKTFAVGDGNCAALVTAMGIHVSYMFASYALPSPEPPAKPPPPSPAEPPRAPPAVAPPVPLRVEIGASPLVAFGIAPGIAFGGTLHFALRWPSFSIGLEGRADAPASGGVDTLPGATVKTSLIAGSLAPCWHAGLVTDRLLFMGCGLVTLGGVRGEAAGVDVPRSDSTFYAGAGARAGLEVPFSSRFAARLYGDALIAIRGVRITLDGAETWRSGPVSGDVSTALVAFF